jgi:hypothetical protein
MSLLDFGKKKSPTLDKKDLPKLQAGDAMYARELYTFIGDNAYAYSAGTPGYYITLLLGKIVKKGDEPDVLAIRNLLAKIGMVSLDDIAEVLGESDMEIVLKHVAAKYEPKTVEDESPSEKPN